jgi:aminoglycoside 3-N-acetyltransferase
VEPFGWMRELKQRAFPKGMRRWGARQTARVLDRTGERDFIRCFGALQIPAGSVVCVHAAMSGFGFLPDGLTSVLSALQKAVPDCTAMMPSFPFSNSTLQYLERDPVFERDTTPSLSGALSEAFRRMPGVVRGYHPTHPCLAFGPQAAALIDGSEHSPTPFGENSTYGRYSRLPNAVLLLLHTNSTSHVHRLQELVEWPNLFLPGTVPARGYDASGAVRTYQVHIHRPRLPLYPVVPGAAGEPGYLWLPDYVLQFPAARREKILARLAGTEAAEMLAARQEALKRDGTLRIAPCGPGEVMVVDLQRWQARMCDDLRRSFAQWQEAYSLEALMEAERKGLLG